jgi:hypothetical protein
MGHLPPVDVGLVFLSKAEICGSVTSVSDIFCSLSNCFDNLSYLFI